MKAKAKYALIAAVCMSTLGGCNRPHSEETAKTSDPKSEPPQVAQTAELAAADSARTLTGVATVLNADTLLQIDADLRSATLSADFSRGTATRYKSTNSLSRQTIETAERQAGTDGTQQKLLETRLKHTWGDTAPFLETESRQKLIASLSAGTGAIVRMDFPELTGGTPRNVRVAPLSGGDGTPVKEMWAAPTGNQSMPGVSFFGLIDAGPGLRPGDRNDGEDRREDHERSEVHWKTHAQTLPAKRNVPKTPPPRIPAECRIERWKR